uniref:beta-carotene 3-hydroxylase n=1 Tax=Nicotiana sylvestris TaxID=4096 RepID=A0A1U7XAX0_NICSY|nr:PREDICTED: beta-carotene hydroxylase 2, chloroplastic-like [Nicotiana sylvestris]
MGDGPQSLVKRSAKVGRVQRCYLDSPIGSSVLGTENFQTIYFRYSPFLGPNPVFPISSFSRNLGTILRSRRKPSFTVCFVLEDEKLNTQFDKLNAQLETGTEEIQIKTEEQISATRLAEKLARKKSERFTYLVAAVMSIFGITSLAIMAVYYRFSWQMEGGEVPLTEKFGTFALSVGVAVSFFFSTIF